MEESKCPYLRYFGEGGSRQGTCLLFRDKERRSAHGQLVYEGNRERCEGDEYGATVYYDCPLYCYVRFVMTHEC